MLIQKGGQGSGTIGHRTVKDSIAGIDSDTKKNVLDKLKTEQKKRAEKKRGQPKQLSKELIQKIIQRVKEKLQKEVSKEDWIQAWKEDPHWDKREPSKLVNRLLDETDKKKVLNILELGCGNGVDSIAFGEKGHKVIGIDISPDAIKLAKKNNKQNNVTFEVGDAEKLKFKDNQFDLVYSMAVLHSSDLKKSIAELSRVLKPSGKSLLFLYQKTEYEYNDTTEENFKFKTIEGLFDKNGLKVLSKDKTEKRDKDENGTHYHYSVIYILEKA
jgi:ubiquinone/menaquinone biosynthesis C-methylase UbiE